MLQALGHTNRPARHALRLRLSRLSTSTGKQKGLGEVLAAPERALLTYAHTKVAFTMQQYVHSDMNTKRAGLLAVERMI